MNKIDDWLKEVLQNPVFADMKPQQHRATSSDRLVKSFQEVLDFVEKNNRLPQNNSSFEEKKLYLNISHSNGIRGAQGEWLYDANNYIWKNNDVKLSEIKFVYGSKKWDTASTRDLFNFISWIGGDKSVASLEDYINAAWDYAFTCNKYAGQRARKWDIVNF
jgi:hypothetical protein